MAWNPETDRLLKTSNNPEKKPETYPKKQGPSDDTLRKLGRTAIKGK
jgi:hypothetical protein